ncbi:unnamed protein product [Adineta steineri]|uniref:Uncharacterized protein n=2 Tax=Adineta steineri TaxID=433720 RepID=A0A819RZP2_9BILA|nr:unnamed protein product [Adineta steineri]CAF1415042.1 unnamed protein product [Adineta steineri]CAF1454505.1 unnamed protein product [Adineta steineri]CAF3914403.1 unnamed protein product [Adineta steineri]CAF4050702.1 unnamed protein product [Adineta steineri]
MPANNYPTGMSNVTARHFQRVSRDIQQYNNANNPSTAPAELVTASDLLQYHHESNAAVMAPRSPLDSINSFIERFIYDFLF